MSVHDPNAGYGDFARSFRRKMMDRKDRQGRSGRPMTIFRVRNRFKPPQGDYTWIRLLAEMHTGWDGSKMPCYEYGEHYNATIERTTICSKVWRETPNGDLEGNGKCIPCYYIDEEGARNINFRRMAGFLLIHLDWFYLVPATDRKGNPLSYRQDTKYHKKGEPIMDKLWVEGVDERELDRRRLTRRDLRNAEKVFGNLMHWSLGTNHLLVLSSEIVGLMDHCHCGGEINTLVYECPNCGHEVFDLTSGDCEYSRKELNLIVVKPVECPNCNERNLLTPLRECDNCKDPNPLRLWDVDLCVGREGDGTSSQLIVRGHKHLELDERVADLVPQRDILHRVFAPDDLDYQEKQMRLDNPWKDREARRHVQDYDDDDRGRDKDKSQDDAGDDDIPF
jgi:DNA-directed RNA polymerase subunit RPC12/RpoP